MRTRPGYLDHFRQRVLQDALAEVLPEYWERRAAAFDTVGTPDCDDTARACRTHARLLRHTGLPRDVLAEILTEMEAAR